MDLMNIKEYVQKIAVTISKVAKMQVLIANKDLIILGDSICSQKVLDEEVRLTENSLLALAIKSRKMTIAEDCQNKFHGCKDCPKKNTCDINSMICLPIIDGDKLYGGIGLYAHDADDVNRLINKNNEFIEFIYRMSEMIIMKLKEEYQTQQLRDQVKKLQNNSSNISLENIIGRSTAINLVKERANQFAKGNSTILLQGESGTGKEIFARAIHTASRCSDGPFVAINCAALPENLIESELFGYEEGAFTGAVKGGKIGKFELADGGTLFLDEIGEFPIHLQAKLLRALQERKIQRVGGNKEIPVSVRIIAATNRDLEELVSNGEFREDLYYRLNVIPLEIPPLRERKGDISDLAEYYLRVYAKALDKEIFGFDKRAISYLYDYNWPGNIRELQNTIEYAVNIATDSYITTVDLPAKFRRTSKTEEIKLRPLKVIEDEYIKEALRVYGDTLDGKTKAAEVLGISMATLYRRIRNF